MRFLWFHTVGYKNHSAGYIFHSVEYKNHTVKQNYFLEKKQYVYQLFHLYQKVRTHNISRPLSHRMQTLYYLIFQP